VTLKGIEKAPELMIDTSAIDRSSFGMFRPHKTNTKSRSANHERLRFDYMGSASYVVMLFAPVNNKLCPLTTPSLEKVSRREDVGIPKNMKRILAMIISLSIASDIRAEQSGSFFLQDIKELLDQQRVLWDSVQSTFDIYSVGDAARVGRADNQKLAGTRIGPYQLWAKPRNQAGPFIFEIDIETETSFLDESNTTVDVKHATDLRERIIAIKIKPLAPSEYFKPPTE
jgi:hypothetical protein